MIDDPESLKTESYSSPSLRNRSKKLQRRSDQRILFLAFLTISACLWLPSNCYRKLRIINFIKTARGTLENQETRIRELNLTNIKNKETLYSGTEISFANIDSPYISIDEKNHTKLKEPLTVELKIIYNNIRETLEVRLEALQFKATVYLYAEYNNLRKKVFYDCCQDQGVADGLLQALQAQETADLQQREQASRQGESPEENVLEEDSDRKKKVKIEEARKTRHEEIEGYNFWRVRGSGVQGELERYQKAWDLKHKEEVIESLAKQSSHSEEQTDDNQADNTSQNQTLGYLLFPDSYSTNPSSLSPNRHTSVLWRTLLISPIYRSHIVEVSQYDRDNEIFLKQNLLIKPMKYPVLSDSTFNNHQPPPPRPAYFIDNSLTDKLLTLKKNQSGATGSGEEVLFSAKHGKSDLSLAPFAAYTVVFYDQGSGAPFGYRLVVDHLPEEKWRTPLFLILFVTFWVVVRHLQQSLAPSGKKVILQKKTIKIESEEEGEANLFATELREVDVLRGLGVVLYLVANLSKGNFYYLEQSQWNGFQVGDFGPFLIVFVLGFCIPLSLSNKLNRKTKPSKKSIYLTVLVKSLVVFFIGSFHLIRYHL